jgi:hypothetical protein
MCKFFLTTSGSISEDGILSRYAQAEMLYSPARQVTWRKIADALIECKAMFSPFGS